MTSRPKLLLAFTMFLLGSSASMARADDLEMSLPAQKGVDVQVINGATADPLLWPSTFIFRTADGGCTATAIGPKALLTAAHCVTDGQEGTIVAGTTTAKVHCSHHPDYPLRISADFALCRLDTGLKKPELGFETLSSAAAVPAEDAPVVLLGYGCQTKLGKQFGLLFQGEAKVKARPAAESWYVITQGAALCYGDSGGGAFTTQGFGRRLFGVNSRGDISQYSWLSATAMPSFRAWAGKWAEDKKVEICGLNANAADCRQ